MDPSICTCSFALIIGLYCSSCKIDGSPNIKVCSLVLINGSPNAMVCSLAQINGSPIMLSCYSGIINGSPIMIFCSEKSGSIIFSRYCDLGEGCGPTKLHDPFWPPPVISKLLYSKAITEILYLHIGRLHRAKLSWFCIITWRHGCPHHKKAEVAFHVTFLLECFHS